MRAISAAAARAKRGRGAGGKVPVFGLLKRGGKVHAVIIPNVGSKTLFPVIRARIKPDAAVYSDTFPGLRRARRVRVPPHANQPSRAFRRQGNHINGIENFWSQAKRHLRRYNGVPKAQFPLYLKECEWRFNYRPANRLLATLKTWLNETRSVPI